MRRPVLSDVLPPGPVTSVRATVLHDPFLVGNGEWCSTCCPDGPPGDLDPRRLRAGCNQCAGRGRIAYSAEQVVSETTAANRAARYRKKP